MQKLLDNLKNAFPSYHEEVNKAFRENTHKWEKLFIDYATPDIFRGLLFIVKTFLNNDKKQLFIQFPTDRLGRFDSDHKENRKKIQELFTDLLFLSSKSDWQPQLNCPEINNTKIGEFYYSANKVWEIKESGNDGQPRPSSIDGHGPGRTPEARRLFNESRAEGIRLLSTEIPPRKIKSWVERINLYRDLPSIADYGRCTLVGTNQYWPTQPIGVDAIYCPIKFITDFEQASEECCDILVFLWDRKYMDYEREINNLIVEGKVKKVIFIGSRIFDGYKEDEANSVYSFTFRELFSYYFGVGGFPNIIFNKITFPKLDEGIKELLSLIPESLDDISKKRVLRYALYPFLRMEHNEPDPDKFNNYLWENFEILSADEIEKLVFWVRDASFGGTSPKRIADSRIISTKEKFYICPSESYKDRLNSCLKERNSKKKVYIIDALINSQDYVDITKTLLEKGCLGTYQILSYFELPILEKFFSDEINVYNEDERSKLLGINLEVINKDATVSSNLLDYYDASLDDLSAIFTNTTQQGRFQTYTCNFSDISEQDIIDGDIICCSEIISIDELYEKKYDFLPCKITYYKSPSNFQHLMEVYFNFPNGRNVEYFASLWKEHMRRLLKDKYNNNAEDMHKDFRFLKIEKLKSITRPAYRSNFPEEIGKITSELNKQGCITEDEARLIRAANSVVGKHSSKAKELKSSLLKYKLTGAVEPFLKQLITNANSRDEVVDVESIASEAMITRTITEITLNRK